MGEGTTGLETTTGRNDGQAAAAPAELKRELEAEIVVTREELGELVAELDRRRHEALDIRRQLRRHALETTLSALALVGVATAIVSFGIRRTRRRQRLSSQAGRLAQAISRMIDRPERVATEPTVARKIVAATASAAAATLVKQVLERVVRNVVNERRRPPTAVDVTESRRPDVAA